MRKRTAFGQWLSKQKGNITKEKFSEEIGFGIDTMDGWLYRGVRPRLVNAMQIVRRLEACGQGHISQVLDEAGYEVRSTDLIDRGYGSVLNFLECEELWRGDIITNPPFKLSAEFIRKSLSLVGVGQRVIFFQRLNFLESAKRFALFQEFPIQYVYVHASRVGTAMGGDFERYHAKSMAYAWYVWKRGYDGHTVMRWIP
mgnify:CR=1 FL=1